MKILLALIAVGIVAVLAVSATMGAGTLVPGGDSSVEKKNPPFGVTANGKARLLPMSFTTGTFKGVGFKSGENVTVRMLDDARKATKRVRADARGSFTVRMGLRMERCYGGTVTAVGDKGSRTSFNFSHLLCAAPGTRK
jgi:hypothetical protein